MKRQIQIWGSRLVLVAIVVFATQQWGLPMYKRYFSPKKNVLFVPTAKVQQGKFTVSFHEIGTLDAEKSVPVYGEDDGKIISLVQEGTMVKAGDKIAEMDTTGVKKDLRNQKLTVKNSQADVDRVKEEQRMLKLSNQTELDKQQAQYDFNVNELKIAQQQKTKITLLADEKLVPRDQVDDADLQVRSKQLAVDQGNADLILKKKDIESKEAQKQAEVDKTVFALNIQKSNLDELQSQVTSGLITAPAPGMAVISKTWGGGTDYRKLQAGDQIHHRQVICQLPDLSHMEVKVNVGESDAPKVKLGMAVMVKMEAIPDRTFHGTVSSISSLATEGNPFDTGSTPGRKNFEVIVTLKEADPKVLKPGMTADAEFICEAVNNSVFVPLESVTEKDGKTFVFLKNGKRWERTRILTGKYNDNFVIVQRGLKKDQIVALRDPTRPMDEQEAGASGPGAQDQKDKKGPAPLPEMPSSGAAKK